MDTRVGRPSTLRGEEATWHDWSFKLRVVVGAVDHALSAAMERGAEATAFQAEWSPSVNIDRDADMQLNCLLVMQTEGAALHIIRQANGGITGYRALARLYNPRSQARAFTQLQEIMAFDFGSSPPELRDRVVMFDRMVAEHGGPRERRSPAR